jgi:hypothetical protein
MDKFMPHNKVFLLIVEPNDRSRTMRRVFLRQVLNRNAVNLLVDLSFNRQLRMGRINSIISRMIP